VSFGRFLASSSSLFDVSHFNYEPSFNSIDTSNKVQSILIVAQKRKIYNLRQALDEEGRFLFFFNKKRKKESV
jgi:hypothetical protein